MKTIFKPLLLFFLLAAIPSLLNAEYLSVFTEKANVRSGPGIKYKKLATVKRYTPFEIIGRKGKWCKIKDFEGGTGWIHISVLAGTPCLMVKTPKANLRAKPGGVVLWILEKTYPLKFIEKRGSWYHVKDGEIDGWLHFSTIWGFIKSSQ